MGVVLRIVIFIYIFAKFFDVTLNVYILNKGINESTVTFCSIKTRQMSLIR